ncbi:ankyrin repeat domain-containing protein 33B-like [Coregonus clupeaformis]|uniref:ankyrin repeat domain-containing protein 33B-like n=1 Tax=Coregonus clupeaformis TaxID=59861 RepID=UPI001BDFEB7E|nr:ankyrin repeat domain-containing protein 33B-like [Coregonus clupeaformis]
MVLITDERDGGGSSTTARVKQHQQQQSPKGASPFAQVHPTITDEPPSLSDDDSYLGSCESEGDGEDNYEEYDDFSLLPDTKSIASDDSFYPPDDAFADNERTPSPQSPEPLSFFQACCTNNATIVRIMIRQGVREAEVRETDKNNRTGLMVACYQGYVDVVIALAQCCHLDVNWQDTEGNTALITAAQAGHIMISNYLLNYFPGLDIERRNCHGFTALMKAAMQGRVECVRALMLAGADMEARDFGRQLTSREWAFFTGRYDTAWAMTRLHSRPCPYQLCDAYSSEWPQLASLVSKAREPRGCMQYISDTIRNALTFANITEPDDEGVLDHLVTVTTALGSPFVAMACSTVCPASPPCVGKRRYSVPEILRRQRTKELKTQNPERLDNHRKLFQNSRVTLVPKPPKGRRSSLPQQNKNPTTANPTLGTVSGAGASSSMALRKTSLLPLGMVRRSSVRPGLSIPKVRISKAPTPTYEPERVHRKSSFKDGGGNFLQLPKWRYKELKEERKRAEEAERRRVEVATKRHLAARKRK